MSKFDDEKEYFHQSLGAMLRLPSLRIPDDIRPLILQKGFSQAQTEKEHGMAIAAPLRLFIYLIYVFVWMLFNVVFVCVLKGIRNFVNTTRFLFQLMFGTCNALVKMLTPETLE